MEGINGICADCANARPPYVTKGKEKPKKVYPSCKCGHTQDINRKECRFFKKALISLNDIKSGIE
jgi:hypothetical protein